MKYPKIHVAQTVVALCQAKGIKDIVISPGSRNAPLTIGFTENPFFNCYSIVDERCAAFFALGMAQQLRKPVVVVCTSGSALLNYYPAVSEAFYSDIPLVVISADRPKYRIDIGDGQTIRQDHVFDRHILGSFNLKQDVNHASEKLLALEKHRMHIFMDAKVVTRMQTGIQEHNELAINEALNLCMTQQGPVHLNVPMEEPLYETEKAPSVHPQSMATATTEESLLSSELEELASQWNGSAKKMILVGVNPPESLTADILEQLAEDPSVVVFTETTSNIHHPAFFPSIDKLIAPFEKHPDGEQFFKELQPDIVLTFGGMVVSKKIKAFLRKQPPKAHWHIDVKKAYDTFYCLRKHVKAQPQLFFKAFLPLTTKVESSYQAFFQDLMVSRRNLHTDYLQQLDFGDFVAFNHILKQIPQSYHVQLGNSSTVRYVQLFDNDPSWKQFCNRGTSGIDGSTSTAIGASLKVEEPTLLITGDLSFFYDSNALWNAYTRPDFRIIVINNGGGGIFRILPGATNSDNFERFFETTHGLNAQHLCQMFGWHYLSATNQTELDKGLEQLFSGLGQPVLLEVFTPREENDQQLLAYFDFLNH